tara:strand:+ start:546 stop:1361 length:816 start_codon:yes stop_codon:yes gene_type:complete
MITYINGEFQKNKRIVSINDRGYLLGDGLYDTILYKDSELTFFNFHYQRLYASASKFKIKFGLSKKKFHKIILELINHNKLENSAAIVRITLTRETNARGLDFDRLSKSNLTIKIIKMSRDLRLKPLKIKVSKTLRNETSVTSKFKTTNYIDNIIEKNNAQKANFDDVLFMNLKHNVTCCSTANIYYCKNNRFFTPPISDGVLNGAVRDFLIRKKKVAVKSITFDNLIKCDEVFVSNSVFVLRPVTKINNKRMRSFEGIKVLNNFLKTMGI